MRDRTEIERDVYHLRDANIEQRSWSVQPLILEVLLDIREHLENFEPLESKLNLDYLSEIPSILSELREQRPLRGDL